MTGPDLPMSAADLASEHGRLAVHYDLAMWMSCPPAFPEGYDRKTWALTFAEAFSRRPGMNPSQRDIDRLAASLERIHTYTYSHVACHMCFIHQPHPSLTPLPVYMATWRAIGGREEALRRLTNADDPDSIQPPYVEEITARGLGDGLKVLRYGREPGKHGKAGKLFAALNYAWRDDRLETDLRVFAATGELGRLQQAIPDIDELVNVTKIVPAPPQ